MVCNRCKVAGMPTCVCDHVHEEVEAHDHLRCVVGKEGDHQLTLRGTSAPPHHTAGRQRNRTATCQHEDTLAGLIGFAGGGCGHATAQALHVSSSHQNSLDAEHGRHLLCRTCALSTPARPAMLKMLLMMAR
jgi:hypothetical protein